MSRPHSVRNFALAFLSGCLMTYLCMRLKSKLDRKLLSRKDLGLPELQPADVSLPASLGLSPMALSMQTGSATVAPDRLIVAVRHGEVWKQLSSMAAKRQGPVANTRFCFSGMDSQWGTIQQRHVPGAPNWLCIANLLEDSL